MSTIPASEFQAKCLALMDSVAATGEVLIITKNGRPVAQLRPYRAEGQASPFGLHRDVQLFGDVIAPIEDLSWKALE